MNRLLIPLACVIALALGSRDARAQNTLFISDNVITGNTWHAATDPGDGTSGSCGLTNGRVNFYRAPFFTDQTADTYSLSLFYESFQFGFVYLYEDAFDPEDPCDGIFVFGFAPVANITGIPLDAHRQYVFVTSEDRLFGGGGSFQVTITGPAGSNLRLGTLPSAAVAVTVEPAAPPVVIPPEGGSFAYTLTLTNSTAEPQTTDVWTAISGPVSREPAFGPRSVMLAPGAALTRTLRQRVPAGAPAGTYTYTASVGAFPGALASDSFTFEKQAGALAPPSRDAANAPEASVGWDVTGWTAETAAAANATSGLPDGFALSAVAPNPFRSTARFTLEVAEAQAVRVEIYDALGRRVALLHDGALAAGAYPFVLDASALPGGVYVVRAMGESFTTARRAVLVR